MPSKNNKKKAAAERSARLAAEAADANPDDQSTDTPGENPVTAVTTGLSTLSVSPKNAALAPTLTQEEQEKITLKEIDSFKRPYKTPAPLEKLAIVKPIQVTTNSYQMAITSVTVYRHIVTVSKYIDGKEITLAGAKGADRHQQTALYNIMEDIIKQEKLKNEYIAYDGATTLYSVGDLQMKNKNFFFEANQLSQNLRNAFFPRNANGSLTVTIAPNEAQFTLNTKDVLNENLNLKSSPVTQMLQIALVQEAKRNKFSHVDGDLFQKGVPSETKKGVVEMNGVGAGLKIAEGLKGDGCAHLVIEYKKKQFFMSEPLQKLGIDFNDRVRALQFLKGIKVGTVYSNQTFVIQTLSDCPMVDITYDGGSVLKDGAKKAGRDEKSYNKTWPAVQTKLFHKQLQKWITYSFPIENLKIIPNQKLTPKHGNPPKCAVPKDRFEKTKIVGESANLLSPNETLKAFGAKIDPSPIKVNAVTVSTPVISYNKTTTVPNLEKQAKWEARGTFVEPVNIPEILMLYNTSSCRSETEGYAVSDKVHSLKEPLKTTARSLGVTMGNISSEDLARTYPHDTVVEAIKKKMESLKNLSKKPVVVYIDDSSQQTHGMLKLQERLCDVVTQQMSLDKSLKRTPGKSTLTNFVLKLNVKSGGLNHKVVPDPMISHLWGDNSKTLIISYDVCHSSGRVYKKDEVCDEPSCVGITFNGNKQPESIIGDFNFQDPRTEQVDKLILYSRSKLILSYYVAARGKLPENIVILRDGVSEGQHQIVFEEEFPAIKAGVVSYLKGAKKDIVKDLPSFALFVVTKQHSNRLYLQRDKDILNVPPLTAIDRVIVKKAGNELIFVSHCPLNGTAQPIVINMLHNEKVFKKNDELVRFMAALCCSHQSSTTIVSLPETIYAADEYAKRGADMFQVYKQQLAESKTELPKVTRDGKEQIDWDAVSRSLCYHFSSFKRTRIA